MITHNGKQVTLAMRNRKSINLIARNGKAMFGEFIPGIGYVGIDAAAKAVILAEYGSVVWIDVKQYAKAHPQIVEFINQDPHLAASISTNSTKIRTATIRNKSANNSKFNGLILPTPFSQVGKMEMTIQAEHNNTMILSGATSDTTMSGYYTYGGNNQLGAGTITRTGTWSLNELVSVGLDFVANTKSQNIRICGWTNTSYTYDLIIESWDIYATDDTTLLYQLVPFVTAEGEVCFLNLVDCTLQHNVYTDPFTIAVTDKE